MKNLLFITNDIIGDTSAGPGIRYVELGKALAGRGYSVTIMGRNPRFTSPQWFIYAALTPFNLFKNLKKCDTLVFRGGGPITTLLVLMFAFRKDVIADLYAFTQFEVPHMVPNNRREGFVNGVRNIFHPLKLRLYSRYIKKFWVANERQKNFLYGVFYTEGQLNEGKDISVIPFGYPAKKPDKIKPVLRGVVEGISDDDFILIWGGGVWDWLDPLTLIKAMALVKVRDDKIKAYFMGMQAPSGYLPKNGVRLMETCRELGLLNKNVFINTGWVPYIERTAYLLEADAGVSLHPDSLETRYSFRTRTLDYIYCGLPMVHTAGDVWAKNIERNRLGIIVPPGDERAVANAILRLHHDKKLLSEMKDNINSNFAEFTWDNISMQAAQSMEKSNREERGSYAYMLIDLLFSYLVFAAQIFFLLIKITFKNPRPPQGESP